MKRTFLILASALALVSCRSVIFDEVMGVSTSMDNTIQVNAMIGSNVMTRVAKLPDDTLTTGGNLKSFSMSARNGNAATFSDVVFTKDSTGKFSSSDGTQYWATGKFAFVAWADNNGSKKGSEILRGYSFTDSQVTGTYGIPAYKYDETNQPNQQNDPVLGISYTEKPSDGNTVDVTFQHLLSRVSINICAPYYLDSTICLLDFGFSGVDTTGTFTCVYPKDDNNEKSLNNTESALPAVCWNATANNAVVGEYGNENNSNYWWEGACANRSTIIRKTLTGEGKLAAAPWLNVIPNGGVATSLQVRFQFKKSNGEWETKTATVSLANTLVDGYAPGKQYIYNVRMLGQNEDDATLDEAKIQITSVTVEEWNTSSLTEQKSSNIGIGKGLQDLVDEIEAGTGYGTIHLAEDFTLYDSVVIHTPSSGKSSDITININGYNITAVDSLKSMFKVESGAKLTFIETGRTSGSTTTYGSVTGANKGTIFKVASGGALTIESGDYTFKKSGTDTTGTVISTASSKDSVSVTGGTFTMGSTASPFIVTSGSSGSVIGILTGGTYVGGYSPVPYHVGGNDETVAQGYTSINTSANPVKWQVVINGESFSINNTQSVNNVTAD